MKLSKAVIFFSLYLIFTNSNANEKSKIINKLNDIDNIQFKFIQKTNEKIEKGKCILAFPNKLKGDYEDKNKKGVGNRIGPVGFAQGKQFEFAIGQKG